MTIRILAILVSAFTVLGFPAAHAGELDNESQVINQRALRAKDLPGTVVVRQNVETGEISTLEIKGQLKADQAGAAQVEALKNGFKTVQNQGAPITSELDRDSSTSAWFFCRNCGYASYYAPVFWYSGYQYVYSSYYAYAAYGFRYWWYGWSY